VHSLVNKKLSILFRSDSKNCRGTEPSIVHLIEHNIQACSLFHVFSKKIKILCEFPKLIVVVEPVDVS